MPPSAWDLLTHCLLAWELGLPWALGHVLSRSFFWGYRAASLPALVRLVYRGDLEMQPDGHGLRGEAAEAGAAVCFGRES